MLSGITTVANPQAGLNCIANSKISKMVSDRLTNLMLPPVRLVCKMHELRLRLVILVVLRLVWHSHPYLRRVAQTNRWPQGCRESDIRWSVGAGRMR